MAESRAVPDVASRPLLAEMLTLAQRRVSRQVAATLADEGCTLDEWRVMRVLADEQGHPMGELAESLLIPHASLTRIVDTLAASSLVYRRQSTTDRRRVAVHLSREGRTRLARLDALVQAQDAALRSSGAWHDLAEALEAAARQG